MEENIGAQLQRKRQSRIRPGGPDHLGNAMRPARLRVDALAVGRDAGATLHAEGVRHENGTPHPFPRLPRALCALAGA